VSGLNSCETHCLWHWRTPLTLEGIIDMRHAHGDGSLQFMHRTTRKTNPNFELDLDFVLVDLPKGVGDDGATLRRWCQRATSINNSIRSRVWPRYYESVQSTAPHSMYNVHTNAPVLTPPYLTLPYDTIPYLTLPPRSVLIAGTWSADETLANQIWMENLWMEHSAQVGARLYRLVHSSSAGFYDVRERVCTGKNNLICLGTFEDTSFWSLFKIDIKTCN